MSQVKFETKLGDKNIEIVAGWDRPLDSYHFTVFDMDSGDEDDNVLYDVWSAHGFIRSTKEIRDYLVSNNISIPEDFLHLVEERVGNVLYLYKNNSWVALDI